MFPIYKNGQVKDRIVSLLFSLIFFENIFEAQISRVTFDTDDSWFISSRKNNLDCFNQCILTPDCVYVSRLYDGNCYLKKTFLKRIDGSRFKNTEYAIISSLFQETDHFLLKILFFSFF